MARDGVLTGCTTEVQVPKSPPPTLFVLTISARFELGTSLLEQVMF